jgi:hypothetical protein
VGTRRIATASDAGVYVQGWSRAGGTGVGVKAEGQLARREALCRRDCCSTGACTPACPWRELCVCGQPQNLPAVPIHPLVCSLRLFVLGTEAAHPLGCTIGHGVAFMGLIVIRIEARIDMAATRRINPTDVSLFESWRSRLPHNLSSRKGQGALHFRGLIATTFPPVKSFLKSNYWKHKMLILYRIYLALVVSGKPL